MMLHKELKKMCDRHNTRIITKNIKNGVINIFIYHIEKKLRGIGGIFFDYKKDNWKKDFRFISEMLE